jgi:surface-anchored protein
LPGLCGCGIPDIDTDGNGSLCCNDACPNDPNKIEEGICGCGVTDIDSDNAGVADCIDYIPIAKITSPDSHQFIEEGESIDFQCSVDSGNPPFTYSWNFDGGAENSTVHDPGDVVFEKPGSYTVTFAVSDNDGDISTDTVNITVNEASDGDSGGFCFINSVR